MSEEEKDELREQTKDAITELALECGLNERHTEFALLYLETFDAKQSYWKVFGCPRKDAGKFSARLLCSPKMKKFIDGAKKIMQINYDLDPSKYVEFLLKAANSNMTDFLTFSEEEIEVRNKEGEPILDLDTGEQVKKRISKIRLKNSDDVPAELLQRISQGRDGVKLELIDKLKCWDRLRDFFGWEKETKSADISSSNIIEAINQSAKAVWDEDEADKDLEETLGKS